MEIQVSKQTVAKVIDAFQKNKLVTRKDIPDLDCPYIGDHLEGEMQSLQNDVSYRSVKCPSQNKECMGVLYCIDELDDKQLLNRLKKFKL